MTAISALMTRDRLVTIEPDVSVAEAARRLAATGVSHLLVTGERQELLGVVCACDLERAPAGSRLRQHLSDRPITVDVETDALVARTLMGSAGVSCLPVTEHGSLRGVITLHDLRGLGLMEEDADLERCSACGSTEHVRSRQSAPLGLCIECMRKSEPPDSDDELGGGD